MIKTLEAVGEHGKSYSYAFDGSLTAPGVITDISGLGPVNADISTTAYSNIDGSYYNKSTIGERSLGLTIVVVPHEDNLIERARRELYGVFAPKSSVVITLTTDTGVYSCAGYVEKCEPSIFSEQVSFEIAIVCPDPYWYLEKDVIEIVDDLDGGFEFPFANGSNMNEFAYITRRFENGQPGERYIETGLTKELLIFGREREGRYIDQSDFAVLFPEEIYIDSRGDKEATADARASVINTGMATSDEVGLAPVYWMKPYDKDYWPWGPNEVDAGGYANAENHNNSIDIPAELKFGNLKERVSALIDYDGDVETGFVALVDLLSGVDDIPKIRFSADSAESLYLDVDMSIVKNKLGRDFKWGDKLEVSTVPGSKRVRIFNIDNAKWVSCMNAVGSTPAWPIVKNGANEVFVIVLDKDDQKVIHASIEVSGRVIGV